MDENAAPAAHKKQARKGKACLIAMPLLLVPLIFLPFDFLTSIIWVTAFGSYVYAIIKLLMMIVNIIRRRERVSAWLLSPALYLLLFPVVMDLHSDSVRAADQFARRTAETVHAACNSAGVCPDEIESFDCQGPGSCNARAGAYGTSYPVLYRREKDRKSFRIAVRHNIDSYFVMIGGKGKELKTERIVD